MKETKAGLKSSTASTDKEKEKIESARKSIELEKEAVKYIKEDLTSANKQHPMTDDLEFKRIVTTEEKVSLVSDSIKTSEDGLTDNGATNLNENLAHNAIHVSSV